MTCALAEPASAGDGDAVGACTEVLCAGSGTDAGPPQPASSAAAAIPAAASPVIVSRMMLAFILWRPGKSCRAESSGRAAGISAHCLLTSWCPGNSRGSVPYADRLRGHARCASSSRIL